MWPPPVTLGCDADSLPPHARLLAHNTCHSCLCALLPANLFSTSITLSNNTSKMYRFYQPREHPAISAHGWRVTQNFILLFKRQKRTTWASDWTPFPLYMSPLISHSPLEDPRSPNRAAARRKLRPVRLLRPFIFVLSFSSTYFWLRRSFRLSRMVCVVWSSRVSSQDILIAFYIT